MIEEDRMISGTEKTDDGFVDRAIRPKLLADYEGQPQVNVQMEIFIEAARQRNEALDHLLIFGPPGLGKTTLSHIVANHLREIHLYSKFPDIFRMVSLQIYQMISRFD